MQQLISKRLPRFAERLKVGNGLQVSPICIGIAGPHVVEAAFEAGINFFFLTADMHWPLYEATRVGLTSLLRRKSVRDDVVVCATAYPTQPEFCRSQFEEVLHSVPGLRRLDVLTAGGTYQADMASRCSVYQRHREESYCGARAIAASFHDRAAARTAAEQVMWDVGFVRFNPVHPGAKRDLFPHLPAARTMPLYAFKTTHGFLPAETLRQQGLDDDLWQPSVVDFYRYALSHAGLEGLLCSLEQVDEVRQLAEALERGPLSDEEVQYLEALSGRMFGRV